MIAYADYYVMSEVEKGYIECVCVRYRHVAANP